MMLALLLFLGCAHPGGGGLRGDPPGATLTEHPYSFEQAADRIWQPTLRPLWRDPTPAERDGIQHLIPALLDAAPSGQVPPELLAQADRIGMVIERWSIDGRPQIALVEKSDQRRGAGAYLFAVGRVATADAPWVLLEAPHAYFDQGTGRIAAAMYLADRPGAPLALFTNSLHRYTQADGTRGKKRENPADAAHNPDHLFAVATDAAARARPRVTVVQIHGFVSAGDDGDPPVGTLAVVSAGLPDAPTPLSSAVATRLKAAFGDMVLLYPTEVKALGATTNVEKKALLSLPDSRFLHVELAPPVRDKLLYEPDALSLFSAVILDSASSP